MNYIQCRNMATLKDIANRLKAVKNIQKITASMKMVSAAKYNKAERDLRPARPYGHGAKAFYQKAEIGKVADELPNKLYVAITSDRGLCGAANSSIAKTIRDEILKNKDNIDNIRIAIVGDKARAILQRLFPKNIMWHFSDVGKKPATFADSSLIAEAIINLEFEYNQAHMYFNTFKSVVSYLPTEQSLFSLKAITKADKIHLYDSIDDDVIKSYNEFTLASLIFFAFKESQCSEQSARMTAMDAASKNAGEMITKLTLTYNRTRQAAITKELTEIVSGASAVAAE